MIDWPYKKRCAVCLTFDFDADSSLAGWIKEKRFRSGYDPTPLTTSSRAKFGQKAITKILKILSKHGVPATFFVPGYTAKTYKDEIKEIKRDGHEIAHHGYYHENPRDYFGDPDKEEKILKEGKEAIFEACGDIPVGYRSPGWELNAYSLSLLARNGFIYDSSLMDDEKPYIIETGEGDIVELPVEWFLDDYPHFHFAPPSVQGLSCAKKVFHIWSLEFEGYYDKGGCLTLTMHPQVIGREYRLKMLDLLITYMKGFSVWFATCSEVASYIKRDDKRR